jgi:hypothetical protein
MVAIKRYGPLLGAGTTITEKLAEATITPSPLGVIAWAGIMEKGPVDELILANSKSEMQRKIGGRIPESYLPICGEDFWDSSKGAGRMLLVRITDGTGRKATQTALSREYEGVTPGPGMWRNICDVVGKSVGRWAGGENRRIGEITGSGDLTETTIDTGLTLKEDEFLGGVLTMAEITGETFEILGNTTAGVVTVRSDSQLLTKFGSGTDNEFTLYKNDNDSLGNLKKVAILWKNGARDPLNEFGLEVYWNDQKVLNYDDLSLDPNSDVYYETVINDDSRNEEVEVTNLFTGTISPDVRPANQAGVILSGNLSALVLTLQWYQESYDAGNTGDGTVGSIAVKANTQPDFITLECTNATTPGSEVWSVTSQEQDRSFDDATTAVAYVGPNDYFIDFTITAGATNWIVGDKIYINVNTVRPDEVIGGRLFYDTENTPLESLEIVDATVSTVSVRAGNDLDTLTAVDQPYRLQYKQGLLKGYDGHAGVDDNDYITAFDPDTSLFNQHENKQLGLIKFAVPGVASTVVQKAARSYGEANNSPFREEIPVSITTDIDAVNWVEETMGRNDFAQVLFPSWYDIQDPDRAGKIRIPTTGAAQGIEARFAYSWNGYHKAAAGEAAILEKAISIPTGERVISGEVTNRKGLQIILKKKGNWVIWGDRVPATSTGLVWKHKREQLSHYERVLFENFDWIIFAINDEDSQDVARASLEGYFLPEWRPKRALRGNTFEEAVSIKIDSENNTDETREEGDQNAEIKLRLADVVERFNIIISPAGVFEQLA